MDVYNVNFEGYDATSLYPLPPTIRPWFEIMFSCAVMLDFDMKSIRAYSDESSHLLEFSRLSFQGTNPWHILLLLLLIELAVGRRKRMTLANNIA